MSKYGEKAEALFREGYNCAQAVFTAFAEEKGMDRETALMLASSFGGGIGGRRETCGAVSGMCMAAGLLRGYTSPSDLETKKEHYAFVNSLLEEFEKENGSIICRDLLGLTGKGAVAPSERTAEYYKKRPCAELVRMAAELLEEKLK